MPPDHALTPPPPKVWGLFVLLLIVDTAAQLFFKIGATRLGEFPLATPYEMLAHTLGMLGDRFVLAGIGCLLTAFVLWLAIISIIDLSEAHPISCLVYGTVAIASATFLGEAMSLYQSIGVLLIVIGAFVTSEP